MRLGSSNSGSLECCWWVLGFFWKKKKKASAQSAVTNLLTDPKYRQINVLDPPTSALTFDLIFTTITSRSVWDRPAQAVLNCAATWVAHLFLTGCWLSDFRLKEPEPGLPSLRWCRWSLPNYENSLSERVAEPGQPAWSLINWSHTTLFSGRDKNESADIL